MAARTPATETLVCCSVGQRAKVVVPAGGAAGEGQHGSVLLALALQCACTACASPDPGPLFRWGRAEIRSPQPAASIRGAEAEYMQSGFSPAGDMSVRQDRTGPGWGRQRRRP